MRKKNEEELSRSDLTRLNNADISDNNDTNEGNIGFKDAFTVEMMQ